MTNGPKGRAEVEEALIAATAAMCRERSPASVTLRGIAVKAGVNHGQVRHYFGSKAELVAATIEYLEEPMLGRLDTNTPEASAEKLLVSLIENPAFARMLGWLLTSEVEPSSVGLRFRFGREFIAQLCREGADLQAATVAASQVMVVCAGWPMIRPLLRESNDLDRDAERALERALVRQVRTITADAVAQSPTSP